MPTNCNDIAETLKVVYARLHAYGVHDEIARRVIISAAREMADNTFNERRTADAVYREIVDMVLGVLGE